MGTGKEPERNRNLFEGFYNPERPLDGIVCNGFGNRRTAQLLGSKGMKTSGEHLGSKNPPAGPFFEVLTAGELAARWRVPESWVREQTRSRCGDPIPHIRLGRYVRFSWGSPELEYWWNRRQSGKKHLA
jgi:hypothetical protein